MDHKFTIGLDFGTNSVRALIVDVQDGREVASYIAEYKHGFLGVLLDPDQPNLARQHPGSYLDGLKSAVTRAIEFAASDFSGFSIQNVIGIGVDTTGSTPLPVDQKGIALGLLPQFADDLNAMAWLWKDHT